MVCSGGTNRSNATVVSTYTPLAFRFVFMLPVLQFTCIPFFGFDVTDILGSFEGCDGGAVIEVRPIARELLSL